MDAALKALIALFGLYLAHSLHRQLAMRVAERRLGAYSALWELTKLASPDRIQHGRANFLSKKEREQLYERMTEWYYDAGNGMLLADGARTMFLRIRDNLICPSEDLVPDSFRLEVIEAKSPSDARDIRAKQVIRTLSLLRTRLKADLGVFGIHYGGGLSKIDKDFLAECGELLCCRPWRKPIRQYISDLV